jgi:hypothetical protein
LPSVQFSSIVGINWDLEPTAKTKGAENNYRNAMWVNVALEFITDKLKLKIRLGQEIYSIYPLPSVL